MKKETMKINGNDVEFKVTDLGYNFGDPTRNGTVVEISSNEGFCRLSDGDAGKIGLYAYHMSNMAFNAAAKLYLTTLFPGMELDCYLPASQPRPLFHYLGFGPSLDGKKLYVNALSMENHQFTKRWEMVWRYWTSHNMCAEKGVPFMLDEYRGTGAPELYENRYTGEMVIRVNDIDLDSCIEDKEYFKQLLELIDQLKK